MSDERKELSILLGYWLKHNGEHAEEFREWAGKVPATQKEVADLLRLAVDKMLESNGYLQKAKAILEKGK